MAALRSVKSHAIQTPRPEGPNVNSDSWAAFFHLVALCGFAVVVILAAFPDAQPAAPVAVAYLCSAFLALFGAIVSRGLGALYLICTYFFAVFTALPAVVQITEGRFPFASTYVAEDLSRGLLVLALGQFALTLGVILTEKRRGAPVSTRPIGSKAEQCRVAARASVFLMITGIVFAVLAGPQELFAARFDAVRNIAEESSLRSQFAVVARSTTLTALLFAIVSLKQKLRSRASTNARFTLIAAIATALTVNFPPALPRFQLLGMALAVLALLVDFSRPLVKLLFTSVSSIFLLYVFSAIKDLSDGLNLKAASKVDLKQYLLTADFDAFKQTVDTLKYFADAPSRAGENFYGALLFWVPRGLWAEKPRHTGELVSTGLGYPYSNVSNPLPAEGYASWGYFGVVGVMLLVGIFIGRVELANAPHARFTATSTSLVLYALSAGYATILLRGAINAVAPMILVAFAAVFGVWLLRRCSSKPNLKDWEMSPHSRSTQRHDMNYG